MAQPLVCRHCGASVGMIFPDANRSIVGNHPLAAVRYSCGTWEYVRHDSVPHDDVRAVIATESNGERLRALRALEDYTRPVIRPTVDVIVRTGR